MPFKMTLPTSGRCITKARRAFASCSSALVFVFCSGCFPCGCAPVSVSGPLCVVSAGFSGADSGFSASPCAGFFSFWRLFLLLFGLYFGFLVNTCVAKLWNNLHFTIQRDFRLTNDSIANQTEKLFMLHTNRLIQQRNGRSCLHKQQHRPLFIAQTCNNCFDKLLFFSAANNKRENEIRTCIFLYNPCIGIILIFR